MSENLRAERESNGDSGVARLSGAPRRRSLGAPLGLPWGSPWGSRGAPNVVRVRFTAILSGSRWFTLIAN